MKQYAQLFEDHHDTLYAVFRISVGLLFAQHGAQKLLGMFGGSQVKLVSLLGLAGVIELVGGLLIAAGLFTRIAALFGVADMVGAQVQVHLPQGLVPIQNGGELALLYLVCFLFILAHGGLHWSLERELFGEEFF
ncbi:MAG: DoxX family protein [Candidatus Nanohaloarchaea archaeon]|nr:DoxX family protein [Candidatus Nanohaloarchaea archaeon]